MDTLEGKRFFIHTFGCQMNENDSEHIAGILQREGAVPASSVEESSIIIVNTCAVREKSVDKLYSLLGRLIKLKAKNLAVLGVAGCVAQLYRQEIIKKRPQVDFVIGPHNYRKIKDILLSSQEESLIKTEWRRQWHEMEDTARKSGISGFVPIMEGCNNFCSYCVVPYARGREKYRPLDNILKEANEMAENGYKELILLGQNVNSYVDPASGQGLPDLLTRLNRIDRLEWIRFITSHPRDFSRKLAETMQQTQKVCRQLHLPIQAGSSRVLAAMEREYTRDQYLEKIAYLRELMPDIHLSTDIIVGFPGETRQDFQETLSVLQQVGYTNIFSFRYSVRPFTKAAEWNDSVAADEKKSRLIEVQKLQKKLQLKAHKKLIGENMRVLCMGVSKKDPQIYAGRNEAYQVINFTAEKNPTGKFVQVEITDAGPYSLRGNAL